MKEFHLPDEKNWEHITPAQQIERWENVERVLTDMPQHERDQHWNMSMWGDKTACGTVACAAGHCGMDPWFRAQGFKMLFYIWTDAGNVIFEGAPNVPKDVRISDWDSDITYPPAFFGEEGCDLIFHESRPRPVEEVIKEVHAYVECLKLRAAA